MQQAIQTKSNPMDADLEKVLPGVYQWHNTNQAAMETVGTKIDQLSEEVKNLRDEALSHRNESNERLAASLIQTAQQLLQQQSPGGSPTMPIPPLGRNDREYLVQNDPVVEAEDNDNDPDDLEHRNYRLVPRHQTLTDMWNEWHGEEQYADSFGGIAGRDKLFGAKWRKHLNN